MELSTDKRIVSMSTDEASSLRGLAVREYNRKIRRKLAKSVRPSEWAMEVSADRMAIVAVGEQLDKAFGTHAPPEKVE